MTLLSTGATPDEAAIRLQEPLDIAKAQLIRDNMCLNNNKQQIYGNTQAVRPAWNERNSVPAVDTTKDLGIHHYGYLHRHPVLDAKLAQFHPKPNEFHSCRPHGGGEPLLPGPSFMDAVSTDMRAIT